MVYLDLELEPDLDLDLDLGLDLDLDLLDGMGWWNGVVTDGEGEL